MKIALAFFGVALLVACGDTDPTYTLYRSSVLDANARYHVATFDAAESNEYNNENCIQAMQLFQQQSGVKAHFWCEKGRFKK